MMRVITNHSSPHKGMSVGGYYSYSYEQGSRCQHHNSSNSTNNNGPLLVATTLIPSDTGSSARHDTWGTWGTAVKRMLYSPKSAFTIVHNEDNMLNGCLKTIHRHEIGTLVRNNHNLQKGLRMRTKSC